MNVITLSPAGLQWQCRQLARTVADKEPQGFQMVASILQGGSKLANVLLPELHKALPQCQWQAIEVDLQRPLTRWKRGKLVSLLPHIPIWILNTLRRSEAHYQHMRRPASDAQFPQLELPQQSQEALIALPPAPNILVIDDAVDTGVTLKRVVEAISNQRPDARISTLAITQTMPDSLVSPDFVLYKNQTLVRFPWSKDYSVNLG